MIRAGTKHNGNTEGERILTRPGCQLNEEEKLDEIKEHFHLERTKFSRARETRNTKWLEMVGSHLQVGQHVSLCNVLLKGR